MASIQVTDTIGSVICIWPVEVINEGHLTTTFFLFEHGRHGCSQSVQKMGSPNVLHSIIAGRNLTTVGNWHSGATMAQRLRGRNAATLVHAARNPKYQVTVSQRTA